LALCAGIARLWTAIALAQPPAEPAAGYAEFVAAAQSGQDVDFRAMREAYAKSPDYDPYGTGLPPALAEMMPALDAGDCEKASSIAKAAIAAAFIYPEAHMVLAFCAAQAGDKAGEAAEAKIAAGLLKSIVDTGDGKAPRTAFRVVAIWEEYSILQLRRLSRTAQRLVHTGGHDYDVLDAKRPDMDGTESIYFRVDGFLDRIGSQLGIR
jgi:hypothetical protein